LVYPKTQREALVAALRAAKLVEFKAKDIFRASQLSLLGISNSHVEKDRAQIDKGEPLSPLLLVRDEKNAKVVVADGYHRLCAVYQVDEDAWIPCKIV
jgi:disulfide oxidoreductase YuzD